MKNHLNYKKTKVPWIGKIPTDWNLIRGKYLFNKIKEINKDLKCKNLLSLTYNGVLNKDFYANEGLRPDNYNTYQLFQKDDLVFKMIDLDNVKTSRVGIVHEYGIISSAYIRFQPIKKKIHPKFAYWFFYDLYKKEIYNSIGSGVRSTLSSDDMSEFEIPLPKIEEQIIISNYIDKKTKQIDLLIEKTQNKITLLYEKRNALINETVIKGVTKNPKMKLSNIKWMRKIPIDWDVKKLKYTSDILPSNIDKHILPEEIQINLCNYTDVYYNEFIDKKTKLSKVSCKQIEYDKFWLRKGDVIITKDSETPDDIGIPTEVKDDLSKVVCGYHLTLIRPKDVLGSYLFRYIQSDRIRKYFEIHSEGVTRFGLGKSTIQNMYLTLPSIDEQKQIVEYLDIKIKKIDKLISFERDKINHLKEYRQSLLSCIITGKVRILEN